MLLPVSKRVSTRLATENNRSVHVQKKIDGRVDAKTRRGQTLLSLTRARYAATATTPPDVLAATGALLRKLGAPE